MSNPAEIDSWYSDFSLNWCIRRNSPIVAMPLSSHAASACAGTWLWRYTIDRSGSIPVAKSIAARSIVRSRRSAGS